MTPSGELSSPPSPAINIPLPAGSRSPSPQAPSSSLLGPLLLVLVAGLAFLLASFPARNSDVWLHLARGRLLAHGESPARVAADLDFDVWGNQTRLYDLFCYECYTALGGAGLMLAKALLAAGIALLLLGQSRSTSGWNVAALCTSLAILTMSKYLVLQPATVSYLLFALTLAYLRPAQNAAAPSSPPLLAWPLLFLFLAWANIDRWFLLGLGVVALAWLGEILDAALAEGAASKRWLALLFRRGFSLLALTAICLLNPSRLDAFVLADELRGLGASGAQLISPFESAYFAAAGWNPASLAYYLLFGVSLLSFAAILPRRRWQRFVPWLGLAILSAVQMRTIPFFAIVAGPVLAWNIRDILDRLAAKERGPVVRAEFVRLGSVLTVTVVLLLLVCAWPGWLQSPPYGARRWAFDLPPSLERVAQTLHRWHEQGKLKPESTALHLSAETVYSCAWFCPEEKRLRWSHEDSAAAARRRMREEGVDHIVVYDADRDRLSVVLVGIISEPEQWPLLYQEGDVAVFGWRDPARPGSADLFRGEEFDLDQMAFHPPEDKKAPPEVADVPDSPQSWWDIVSKPAPYFWKPVPSRSIDRDEAMMHLLHAEALQRQAPVRHLIRWQGSQTAGLVAAANGWAFPSALCDAEIRLALLGVLVPNENAAPMRPSPLDRLARVFQQRYTQQRDDAPPALFYTAIRAARRAVAADPDDALAYLLLGESYLGLLESTRERAWGTQLPQLVELRRAQASAAFNRAVALHPDFPPAHIQLARLYQKMNYLDLTLKHLQTYHRLAREAGPPRGVDREKFQAGQAKNAEDIEGLAREVQKRESSVALRSAESPPRERANLAYRSGLAGKALELLLESDRSAFGNEGMILELDLLLDVGRARDVQNWMIPDDEMALTPLAYHWYRVRALAALGDYTRAEEECDEAARSLARLPQSTELLPLREMLTMMVSKMLLDVNATQMASLGSLIAKINRAKGGEVVDEMVQRLRQQSDLTTLHGLLALEEGEMGEAESAFRSALGLRKGQPVKEADKNWNFNSRGIAEECLRWLK